MAGILDTFTKAIGQDRESILARKRALEKKPDYFSGSNPGSIFNTGRSVTQSQIDATGMNDFVRDKESFKKSASELAGLKRGSAARLQTGQITPTQYDTEIAELDAVGRDIEAGGRGDAPQDLSGYLAAQEDSRYTASGSGVLGAPQEVDPPKAVEVEKNTAKEGLTVSADDVLSGDRIYKSYQMPTPTGDVSWYEDKGTMSALVSMGLTLAKGGNWGEALENSLTAYDGASQKEQRRADALEYERMGAPEAIRNHYIQSGDVSYLQSWYKNAQTSDAAQAKASGSLAQRDAIASKFREAGAPPILVEQYALGGKLEPLTAWAQAKNKPAEAVDTTKWTDLQKQVAKNISGDVKAINIEENRLASRIPRINSVDVNDGLAVNDLLQLYSKSFDEGVTRESDINMVKRAAGAFENYASIMGDWAAGRPIPAKVAQRLKDNLIKNFNGRLAANNLSKARIYKQASANKIPRSFVSFGDFGSEKGIEDSANAYDFSGRK